MQVADVTWISGPVIFYHVNQLRESWRHTALQQYWLADWSVVCCSAEQRNALTFFPFLPPTFPRPYSVIALLRSKSSRMGEHRSGHVTEACYSLARLRRSTGRNHLSLPNQPHRSPLAAPLLSFFVTFCQFFRLDAEATQIGMAFEEQSYQTFPY